MANQTHPDTTRLRKLLAEDPTLAAVRGAAGELPVYLVGGAIRDALCDFPVDDIDLVVAGDPAPLVRALDPAATVHDRFGTAELVVGGRPVDVARARVEQYAQPGALPDVAPGTIEDDLGRRDFTINAIAVPLNGPDAGADGMLDPFEGMRDLRAGVLRALHPRSFEDDPTRALRAARYAARFDFDLSPDTADLLPGVEFGRISNERFEAELALIAREEHALEALRLLDAWGLVPVDPERLELARRALELAREPRWRDAATREELILTACLGPIGPAPEALAAEPSAPSEGVERAGRFRGPELLLARAAGCAWLDRWRDEWRWVELEITGADLLAAGVPQGPAVGAGIRAALRAKLDRGVSGVDAELAVALAAAREAPAERAQGERA